jgi:hypothetical protein
MEANEEPTAAEIDLAIRAHLISHAFKDRMGSLDGRTALIILKHRLFTASRNAPETVDVVPALERPWSQRQRGGATGPLFVSVHKGRRVISELRMLLLDPDLRVRQAAFAELRRLMDESPQLLCPETRSRVAVLSEAAIKDNTEEAFSSSIEVADLLDTDFMYQLTGFRECTALKLDDSIRPFLQRLLNPEIKSIQFLLALPVWSPSRQQDVVESLITRIVIEAASLRALLAAYYRYFGHLALAGAASAGGVVTRWIQSHEPPNDPLAEISSWARETDSPFAEYHKCELLSRNPHWLNEKQRAEWLRACIAVIRGVTSDGPWQLRVNLARHYCRHLETLSPEADGERVAAMAWWLAEQVGAIVEKADRERRVECAEQIADACRASEEAWLLGRPPVQPAKLRYATLFSASLWSSSLLAALAESAVLPSEPECELLANEIGALLAKPAFVHLGFPNETGGGGYAFERPTDRLTLCVEAHRKDQVVAGCLKRLIYFVEVARRPFEPSKLLREWAPADEFDELLFTHELRLAAHCSPSAAESIWQVFSDADWRRKVFMQCSMENLELVCSAAIELQCTDRDHEWRVYLPHFFALACAAEENGSDRQRLLFAYVVAASLAANSVSAIQRILSEPNRQQLSDFVEKWRQRIERAIPIVPPWISAKLRGAKAVLYI